MDISKFISHQIEQQFPSIYREDGPELVEFVKQYYDFMEQNVTGFYLTGYIIDPTTSDKTHFANVYSTLSQANAQLALLQADTSYHDLKVVSMKPQSTYHARRLFEYNDIDSTLSQMLLFYKNKYMSNLPFDETNTRFLVKHILDFYRRKGTKEGLDLFFRLFYAERVDVYYPSQDILKPSASKWKAAQYVELKPQDPSILADTMQLYVHGSISGATAIINKVSYLLVGNTIIPIVYLSNVRGSFVAFDDLVSNGISYGVVRGSLTGVSLSDVDIRRGVSNNNVGDIVHIYNDIGYGGKGLVTSVTEDISGEITFSINDGGFGYTVSNTDIIISNQTIFISNTAATFTPLERVGQTETGAQAFVVGYRSISADTLALGVRLTSANSFTSNSTFFTMDRSDNITESILFAGSENSSANAEIGDVLTNVQTISVVVDLIEDFLDVTLSSNNYSTVPPATRPMTGAGPININTLLSDAFVTLTLDIGTITSLKNINPGADYTNDVFILAKDDNISRFNLTNQVINFNPLTGPNIEVGDIVVQTDVSSSNTSNLDTRGIVRSRSGDFIEIMQLSFQGFTSSNSIFVEGSTQPIEVFSVERNYNSLPMGLNASIDGFVQSTIGKIESVSVFESGIGFLDGSSIRMKNLTKLSDAEMLLESALNNPTATEGQINILAENVQYWKNTDVAFGVASATGQGKSEGRWESKVSHLNSKKVIQDSNFYQDFSYQITSRMNPTTYLSTLKDLAHVAGTKVFHKFGIEEQINTQLDMQLEVVIEDTK